MLDRFKPYLQLAPLTLVLLLFVVAPLVFVFIVSFFQSDGFGITPAFSFENYHVVLTSGLTLQLYLQMAKYALLTWSIYKNRDSGARRVPLDRVGLVLLVVFVGAIGPARPGLGARRDGAGGVGAAADARAGDAR